MQQLVEPSLGLYTSYICLVSRTDVHGCQQLLSGLIGAPPMSRSEPLTWHDLLDTLATENIVEQIRANGLNLVHASSGRCIVYLNSPTGSLDAAGDSPPEAVAKLLILAAVVGWLNLGDPL